MKMELTARYKREAVFHDRIFGDGGRSADRFYAAARASKSFYRQYLTNHAEKKTVLEYGCGPDSHSALLVPKGAKVTGIDLSIVAVQRYQQLAGQHQLSECVQGCVMNAEELAFADRSFDLICGLGILHHLDLQSSLSDVARILKPNGSAVFLEPLGHNPLINMYRRLTPGQRTADEHPLLMNDLELARSYFGRIETTHFHLTSMFALVLRGSRLFPHVLRWCDAFDRMMFMRFKALRKHSWAVAIVMSEPVQKAQSQTPEP